MQRSRKLAIAILAGIALLGSARVAIAQSDGVYNPKDQRCDEEHNDTENEDVPHDNTEPCQNATVFVENGDHEVVRAGTLHTADGTFVHHYQLDGDLGEGADPTKGGRIYFGADDNLSGGEHDGASGMGHGPSDGGGIQLVAFDPASLDAWMAAVQGGDMAYLFTHPFPFLNFSMGACADGICFAVTTTQTVAYQGGDTSGKHRDSADYEGVEWDPATCSGPDETGSPAAPTSVNECTAPGGEPRSIYDWNNQVGTVYNQPGVTVYEDPNPEGSPLELTPYPIPGAYVGTCGAIVSQPSGETIDARHGGCEGDLNP